MSKLLISELAMLLAVGCVITAILVIPKGIFHFHQLVLTTYTNGTSDFSTDATILVRSLGIVSLLTLILGLVIGTTIGLSTPNVTSAKKIGEYEEALMTGGFMKITPTPDGATYELTERGRRFLADYAFLNRQPIAVHKSHDLHSTR